MRHKIYVIIAIVVVFVFGLYNIVVQSCTTMNVSKSGSKRPKVDITQRGNYQDIIDENQNIFDGNIKVLRYSTDWFEETVDLLKQGDLESIMFLYSNGVEKDISDLIYEIYLYSDSKNEKISQELEFNWDKFCDNFEYAYFNKSQGAEYKKYINESIKSINNVIKIIGNI